MKHLITCLLLICSYALCAAQATSLKVDNQTPGWLSSKINYGDQQSIENITITGYINGTDLKFIHELNEKRKLQGVIDLSNSSIISGGDSYKANQYINKDLTIYSYMFQMKNRIRKLVLPKSTTTIQYTYMNGQETFSNIDSIIADCPEVKSFGGVGTKTPNDSVRYLHLGEGITSVDFGNGFGQSDNQVIMLPSSITEIKSQKYFDKGTIWSSILDPTKVSGNISFRSGTIYVPDGTINLYKNSRFMSLKIIENIFPDGIKLEAKNEDIYVGDEFQIKFAIMPYNSIHNELDWKSSDRSVVDVDSNGRIIGLGFGQATITASTINGISASCIINVYNHVTSVSLPENITLNVSENKKLPLDIYPLGKTNSDIIWSSSNENIASVDTSGNVTGVSKGICSVTATAVDGGHVTECTISVVQPVESISITQKQLNLKVGESTNLTYNILPSEANDITAIWLSSDSSIAEVSDKGTVSAISPGKVKVSICSNSNPEISDFCDVTVIQPTSGISLNKSEIEIIENNSVKLIATVQPENASNRSVNWTSSDTSVAMVSPDGTVYAIKPGQASIMATTVDGGFVALCKLTVKANEVITTAIRLSKSTETIAIGETLQLEVETEPKEVTNNILKWSSSDSNIATVNADGLVTAIAEGSAQIIVTTTDGSNLSAICDITVEKQFISISEIKINPSDARVAIGTSIQLNAIISPQNASATNIVWSSTNPIVATVSPNGQVNAIAEGEAIIVASTQDGTNLSATCSISVYKDYIFVSEIILDPSIIDSAENESIVINATIVPDNATNKQLKWSSSDESIAMVKEGVVKLIKNGSATIYAEALDGSDVKSECIVKVTNKSGIEHIIQDQNAYVRIYNLSGTLIHQGEYAKADLEPGIYIFLCNGKSFITKIR